MIATNGGKDFKIMRYPWITFTVAAAAAASSLQAKPFDRIIDAGSDVTLMVENVTELHEALESHPFRDFLEAEGSAHLFEIFLSGADEDEASSFLKVAEERFGLDAEELLALFPGQISLSLDSIIEMFEGELERPDVLIMAEFSGDASRMNELMQIQFEHNAAEQKKANPLVEHQMIERSFLGETLYLDETFDGEQTYIEDGYALVDGIFILASPVARLESTVEAIKSGNEAALARDSHYLRSQEMSADASIQVYCNLRSLLAPLEAILANVQNAGGLAYLGVSPDRIWTALGLEYWDALWLSVELIDDGARVSSGLQYTEKQGLLQLMAYTSEALPEAPYVPESAMMSSLSCFSISEMFVAFERFVNQLSPNLGQMLNLQLLNLQSRTGVDFRSGFLNNFGTSIVSYMVSPVPQSNELSVPQASTIYVFDVPNTQLMGQVIDGLLSMSPPLKSMMTEEAFAGETIHSYRIPNNPNMAELQTAFSYVLTRSQWIVCSGPVAELRSLLSRRSEPETGGFWQRDDIVEAMDRLNVAEPVGQLAYDLSVAGDYLIQSLLYFRQHLPQPKNGMPAVHQVELFEAPFLLVSQTDEADDGIFSHSLILHKAYEAAE